MSIKDVNQSFTAWLSHPETILKAVYATGLATVTMTIFLAKIQFEIDDINRYGSVGAILALKEKEARDTKQDQLLEQVIRTQASMTANETASINRLDNIDKRLDIFERDKNARYVWISSALSRICQKEGIEIGQVPQ